MNPVVFPAYRYHAGRLAGSGPATVSVHTVSGRYLGPLPHHLWHSPDGFQWGYHGSGPAELARCLLLHAFGSAAYCPHCNPTERVPHPGDPDRSCPHCHRGLDAAIIDYPIYKTNILAPLTAPRWTTTSSAVRAHQRIIAR